ncbi:MAG TPA: PIG-L family deacetylase [Propionicimonas sp.]|jgi:N-acetyl-1-D-myo-inositol-2-amino-2-deoxy-alpha-D-glucopyranoside deacetylase|uniref:PIG-L deacetylase family protein n=1 Tax=Propionicimonas sp. TaxID=1955623 RepID=UPI002F3F6C2C
MIIPGSRIVFLHAHPDDETLATGVLLAELVAGGREVAVVTATRGEMGAVVPGPLSALEGTPELVEHRLGELAGALAELGVTEHVFLGTPPARAAGRAPRRYTDSGMRWLDAAETLAGPGGRAGADSLTSAEVAEAAADLAAFLLDYAADALVAYDLHGGYGHPDHVACHHIARAASELTGVPLVEVVSEPLLPVPGAEELALPQWLPVVQRALGHYASQLTVDGPEAVHVGGQRQPIVTAVWLLAR